METIFGQIDGVTYYNTDGKVICNNYEINNSTFVNNQLIKTVDCIYRPWNNNSMVNAFANCQKLYDVRHLNDSITNMKNAFDNCVNLTQVFDLPDSVNDLSSTFYNCSLIRSVPKIPNLVVNMSECFSECVNLRNVSINSSIIENMYNTFHNCINLVDAPIVPNSVINMSGTFYGCNNLKNIPNISSSVEDMSYTFYGCDQFTGDINIYSNSVSNAENCFGNTSLTKNVYIPFYYENGEHTLTYNTFINAGYPEYPEEQTNDDEIVVIETNRVDGVFLMDLFDNRPDIDLSDYIWYRGVGNDNQTIYLKKYIGSKVIVNQPTIE